jgi:hypothetical protein
MEVLAGIAVHAIVVVEVTGYDLFFGERHVVVGIEVATASLLRQPKAKKGR